MKRRIALLLLCAACGETKQSAQTTSAAAPLPTALAPGSPSCVATGAWAGCSLMYRLERAGLVVTADSAAEPAEKALGGTPLMVKVGRASKLEVHFYPDSLARIAAAKTLDHTQFISPEATPTIKRERTLIESVNVIALLSSIDDRVRERVADNIMAGPPQPSTPVTVKP